MACREGEFSGAPAQRGRVRQICELGRGIVPAFGRRDVDIIAAGARHLPGLPERGFGRLPAVDQITVLAGRLIALHRNLNHIRVRSFILGGAPNARLCFNGGIRIAKTGKPVEIGKISLRLRLSNLSDDSDIFASLNRDRTEWRERAGRARKHGSELRAVP